MLKELHDKGWNFDITSSIFQALNGIGHDSHTSKETSSFLLVNLLVVPNTYGYGI